MARKRPRRSGNRSNGGRPRTPVEPVVTEQLLSQRQRRAPGIPTEDLMKQRAGVPLEILAAMPCPDGDHRHVIGEPEIEPRYFDIACRRVEEAYRQADLFVPPPSRERAEPIDLFAESS